jgi:hypothetical protein
MDQEMAFIQREVKVGYEEKEKKTKYWKMSTFNLHHKNKLNISSIKINKFKGEPEGRRREKSWELRKHCSSEQQF